MNLEAWSWLFLVVYMVGMLALGLLGQRRVTGADDFATARGGYGPLFLALAFASTAASGATFIGFPGLVYEIGLASLWSAVLYPAGIYLGVLICIRLVRNAGSAFGSRSIPEYLGERYRSETMRILVSLFSFLLFFYLAGQLVSGLVMFEIMLGLSSAWALAITTLVLVIYVTLGGAHADILTDGVQGLLMLGIGALVVLLFISGYGVEGGFGEMFRRVEAIDPDLVRPLNPRSPIYNSWWSVVAILLAHIPLGMLPHVGNKVWALRDDGDRYRFVRLACFFGLTLAMLGLSGFQARAVLGDALLANGSGANLALPALFIELFPPWLAALLGIGILAAVMSTADGLLISSSQIVANDFYRCTFVPRWRSRLDAAEIDRRVLKISRLSTVGVMLVAVVMAWGMMQRNVALLVWMGVGGLMAAFAGPLVLGAVWRRVTRAGALAGLLTGVAVFASTHGGLIDPAWFAAGGLPFRVAARIAAEAPNPFSCAAMGEIASVLVTWLVSLVTRQLPAEHLARLFPGRIST